ncbi:MAG: SDR family oxidoreductase [Bacteroidota bacterium]
MKILVLGSNGFIGSNVLKHFRKSYPETFGCDVFSPKEYDEKFFLLDKLNPQFDKLFIQNTFDVCINASGSGSVPYSIEHPDEDYRLNSRNVFDILSSISKFNMQCKFLNFSSAAVYGNPDVLPLSEKSRTKPVSPYGFHKLISEQICAEFYHLKKIRTCSMRVFSVYGEGLKKQLLWDMYQKSKQNPNIELFGTGEETRDFIHIKDLIHAIECILEKSAFEADVINVATGIPTAIREVAMIFTNTINTGLHIQFNGSVKQGDPLHLQAGIVLLSSYGFKSSVTLQEGLTDYFKWAEFQSISV